MKKRTLLLMFAMLSCIAAWSADGDTFTASTVEGVEMNFQIISEEENTCKSAGNYSSSTASIPQDYEGMITVPSEANGYRVVEVGLYSFHKCQNVRMVTISEGIETIGYAFYNAKNLKTLVLPKSLKTIKFLAGFGTQWNSTKALEKIVISDLEAWCNVSIIPDWFENPLYYAHHLYLGEEEVTNLVIPSAITSVGVQFVGCTGIKSISIHKDVTKITNAALIGCSGISTIIVDEDNDKYDSRDNCNAIIETGTNTLLCGCKSTLIPASITSIDNYAFYGCTSLETVTIPSGVVSIGGNAFSECSNLASVYVKATTPPTITQYTFDNTKKEKLYVPKGCVDAYANAAYWSDFAEILEIPDVEDNNIVKMPSAEIMTYTNSRALDYSTETNVKAYIASGFSPSTGELTLTRVYKVPAGEGLLLKGNAGEYEIPYAETDMYYSNLLRGVTTATTIEPTADGFTNFILANGTKYGIGFYTLSEAGEIAAGKAYLQLPASVVAGARTVKMVFDDEKSEATGIQSFENESAAGNRYFNLNGQQIAKPTKGLYIINGKKAFVK